MKVRNVFMSISVLLIFVAVPALAIEKEMHWGYEGKIGPENWANLSDDFELCGIGKNQSPINLTSAVKTKLSPLTFNYKSVSPEVLNNGHTIQVNYPAGSHLQVKGEKFELKQFHFHSPSENRINGKSFPLEAHLVHADAKGNLAVVAVMFEQGAANTVLGKVWNEMPTKQGSKQKINTKLDIADLLPGEKSYFRYNGSLTTPPCSEGVNWIVMSKPVTASSAQVKKFTNLMGHANNRPVQRANARVILEG